MYFITEKTSETGKKFQAIKDKLQIVRDAQKAFAKKYKFKAWRDAHWVLAGKMSSCIDFVETPDTKIWGKGANNGEFFPKKNSKEGKAIYQEIKNLPVIEIKEINACVSFDSDIFHTIGFAFNGKTHFGFMLNKDWKVKVPKDCKEVTETEYDKLFKSVGKTV